MVPPLSRLLFRLRRLRCRLQRQQAKNLCHTCRSHSCRRPDDAFAFGVTDVALMPIGVLSANMHMRCSDDLVQSVRFASRPITVLNGRGHNPSIH